MGKFIFLKKNMEKTLHISKKSRTFASKMQKGRNALKVATSMRKFCGIATPQLLHRHPRRKPSIKE